MNFHWCETITAIIIFVFAMWPNLGGMYSQWIVIIAAVALFIHSFMCKSCMMCDDHKSASKKKRQ
jgi:hypothetical protein